MQEPRQGLFAGLKGLSVTLIGVLQTRMELLGNEVGVEKLLFLRMLMLAQALMFSAVIAALVIVALLTLWLWEWRLGVLGVFFALFVGGAALAYRALMRMVQREQSPFAASLGALREDLQRLKQPSSHARSPD